MDKSFIFNMERILMKLEMQITTRETIDKYLSKATIIYEKYGGEVKIDLQKVYAKREDGTIEIPDEMVGKKVRIAYYSNTES